MIKKRNQLRGLLSELNSTVLFDEPMNKYTSFSIGGPAEAMVFPRDERDMSKIIHIARVEKIPLFILGKGSNLLVSDKGLHGIVASLSSNLSGECFRQIVQTKELNNRVYLYAGAGVALTRLLRFTIQNGLSGLEFTAGIPGSFGGAVIMNAGSYGKEIKDVLDSVRIIDRDGCPADIPAKDISFKYRGTAIHGKAIAGAVLRLRKGDKEKIEKTVQENLLMKKKSQPLNKPSAGSIFKNPGSTRAWELIDSVGMRGASVGGACVSPVHANFIVNTGRATAGDVISLIRQIGSRVEKDTGITLELEVKIVGK
ncbi:MAG: UDP-N-acetylenolpyruvoylglucosamine reductase [Nitrospirae bacterium RBG_16_43_11]|nr:MAG: UDP-N-acetylenolpyruvoylglucosamine reductase [Nitrospirae bacterium RBG_16_43_11]